MPIVLISESLMLKTTATDGRILRDRVLSGFGVRLNARKRTFLIATSVAGEQFRMMLGHWPLMTVDEARSHAMAFLRRMQLVGERKALALNGNLPIHQCPNQIDDPAFSPRLISQPIASFSSVNVRRGPPFKYETSSRKEKISLALGVSLCSSAIEALEGKPALSAIMGTSSTSISRNFNSTNR
jgi:hypothetical protein